MSAINFQALSKILRNVYTGALYAVLIGHLKTDYVFCLLLLRNITLANSQFAFVSLLLITRGVEQTYYLMSGQDSRDNEKRACIGDKDTVTNPELLHTIITTCKWNDVIINISLYKSTIMRLLHC